MNFDFSPYVRFVSKSTYFLAHRVTARDCRLLYIISGQGVFMTDAAEYILSDNTLIYYPYGLPYRIKSEKGILFVTINFDFSNDYTDLDVMMPEPTEKFDYGKILDTIHHTKDNIFQKSMYFTNALWAKELIDCIHNEDTERNSGYKEVQSSYLKILLTEICRKYSSGDTKNPLIPRIKETVNGNLTLNIKDIAELLRYHPFYLNEVFKKCEGCSLHDYITKQRLHMANKLITTTHKKLDEIASICGFSSHSHLTTAFKKEYRITPVSLRRQI